jgi:hypothetical protein
VTAAGIHKGSWMLITDFWARVEELWHHIWLLWALTEVFVLFWLNVSPPIFNAVLEALQAAYLVLHF